MNDLDTPPLPGKPLIGPLAVLIGAFALYSTFRSCSPDDWDSYSFILALNKFDLQLQQPHPPGFPVYVFMARALRLITHEALSALTWLSAISGAAAVLLVFALADWKSRGDKPAGAEPCCADRHNARLISAFLFAPLPMVWLSAEKALSDMPGLATVLLALWLSLRADGRNMWLAGGGFIGGVALGVRPQNGLPLALLAVLWLIQWARGRRPSRHLLISGAGAAVAILVWLVPTAILCGGPLRYAEFVRAHAEHVRAADSIFGMLEGGLPWEAALRERAVAFFNIFVSYTAVVGITDPWKAGEWLRVILAALFTAIGLVKADWRKLTTWGLALWALTAAAQVYVLEDLNRPRLMLPILPPLVILVGEGWSRIYRRRWLTPAAGAIAFLTIFAKAQPLAAQLKRIASPVMQATSYVAAHYPVEASLIVAAGSFRAAQVELPRYRLAYLDGFDSRIVSDSFAAGARYVIIFDRDYLPPELVELLSDHGRLAPKEERLFRRDAQVHTQYDIVLIQVFAPRSFPAGDADMVPEVPAAAHLG